MSITVGIDLGTTYSAVAYIPVGENTPIIIPNVLGELTTPSVIHFLQNGMEFGMQAKECMEIGDPNCASLFKRSMDTEEKLYEFFGKAYSAMDLSSLLLAHLKADAEKTLRDTIKDAVVTVPAYFENTQRLCTRAAAKRAGLNVLRLVDEPVAAAMAYGASHWRENALIMVYDLGGGTFDATILRMLRRGELISIATAGLHRMGGADWDRQLCNIALDKLLQKTRIDLREDSETILRMHGELEAKKRQLSSSSSVHFSVFVPGHGEESVDITRTEFEQYSQSLVEQTLTLCGDMLRNQNMRWNQLDDVLLVGGSTRMPMIQNSIAKAFGKPAITHVNPDTAVALGAAIQANITHKQDYLIVEIPAGTNGAKKPVSNAISAWTPSSREASAIAEWSGTHNRVAHALGIIAVNNEKTEYINQCIIPYNTEVPCVCAQKFRFYTTRGENEMDVFVLQGEGKPLDCSILGRYVVSGIQHEKGGTIIRVQYSYDESSIVHVQARQGDAMADLPVRREPVPDDMSKYGRPFEKQEQVVRNDIYLMMFVDVSGSMTINDSANGKSAMENAKDAMRDFAANILENDALVSVGAVSDSASLMCEFSDDKRIVNDAIRSIGIGCTGGGNSAHPFDVALRAFRGLEGKKALVVLADGVWGCQEQAIKAAKSCHEEGIDVVGLGFGSADKNFLAAISSEPDLSFFTSASSELSTTFGSIAQVIGKGVGGGKHGKENDTQSCPCWEVEKDFRM